MRQFLFEAAPVSEGDMQICGRDAHYLTAVLRLKPGDSFPGIDHSGTRYICTLQATATDCCTVRAKPDDNALPDAIEIPYPKVTLYQCISKGKKMDTVIRQATEAGVAKVIPVLSERTVPRYRDGEADKKRDRWARIAREAVQQCGRADVPTVETPIQFSQIPGISSESGTIGLCFHEIPLENGSIHGYLSGDPETICVVIGPEGGLSSHEQEILTRLGYHFCYLGPNVLRTETAALYATAAIMTITMEKDSWQGLP